MSDALIAQGYREAREVTHRHARSFSFAAALLFGARKRAAFALYALCRHLDDLVDESTQDDRAARLAQAKSAITSLFDGSTWDAQNMPWTAAQWAAFRDTVTRFKIPEQPLQDLIAGMEMDLSKSRYASWEELDLYCYRAAGTVGVLMSSVLGVKAAWALQPAADLGRAMQLTNILRDVREDLGRGRVYLPQDELRAFQLSEADLLAGRVDERFKAFMQSQISRARALYARGEAGISALGGFGAQATVRVMGAVYGGILRAIELAGYDVFSSRVHVPLLGKLRLATRALLSGGP
jgi:phytoene synthase